MSLEKETIDMKALVKGVQANIPLAISAMAYGGVFGVLSANHRGELGDAGHGPVDVRRIRGIW